MLTGNELASVAKHSPENLEALSDDIRHCGRRLESFESAKVQSIERVEDADGSYFRVVMTTDDPDVWYWS